MSNKERVIALLDSVPDYKMGYVLAYVQGLTADEEAALRGQVAVMISQLSALKK